MYIGLFKRQYTMRVYKEQTVSGGHASAPFKDIVVRLNVQPLTPDELMALPEGERTVKRVKTFGPEMLASADEYTGTPGVRLFYRGYWYECKSSVLWDHTLLSHYRSDFVILPQREQEPPPEEVQNTPGEAGEGVENP